MDSVNFHTVAAGFLGEHGAVYHDVHEFVYLVAGQRAVLKLGGKDVRQAVAWGDHRPVIIEIRQRYAEVRAQTAAHSSSELQDELGVGLLVELRHEVLQRPAKFVDGLVQPAWTAPFVGQNREAGDYEADSVSGAVQKEFHAVSVEFIVDDRRGAAHCT